MAASDGQGKVTTNTYTNDTTKWLLGRLTRAAVKSCPNGSCQSCNLPWGGQIPNAATVIAYKDSTPTAYGSTAAACVSEPRNCIDGSLSGTYQYAACTPPPCNFETWAPHENIRLWTGIASSADGTKLAALNWTAFAYRSTDSGATWTELTWDGFDGHGGVASSADGSRLAAPDAVGLIQTSTNSGASWTLRFVNGGPGDWSAIASSADGTKLAAVADGGKIFTSSNSGVSWTAGESNRNWKGIAGSSDGTKLAAVVDGGLIHTSTDGGVTWTAKASARQRGWAITCRNCSSRSWPASAWATTCHAGASRTHTRAIPSPARWWR